MQTDKNNMKVEKNVSKHSHVFKRPCKCPIVTDPKSRNESHMICFFENYISVEKIDFHFYKTNQNSRSTFCIWRKLQHLQCRQYYHNNWLLHTTNYWWKEKLKVSVTVIKQRLEYIYVNFSVQNLLYLTCTTPGMPNFLLVCGSVWVQLDMSPRKAYQSIKKFL